jgi:hypothetical protein
MIEFIRGIRTQLSTIVIPASARTASNRAGYSRRDHDQVLDLASGVVEVHDQVPGGLGHPRPDRVGGGAEDAYSAGGGFDDGQDVEAGAGQRRRFEDMPRAAYLRLCRVRDYAASVDDGWGLAWPAWVLARSWLA